jgi:hypothetical protein
MTFNDQFGVFGQSFEVGSIKFGKAAGKGLWVRANGVLINQENLPLFLILSQ